MSPGNFPVGPPLHLAVVGVGRVFERLYLAALRRSPGFGRQLAAWAVAVRGGHPPLAADGSAGQRCVELVEACRRSMAVGGAGVPVPEPEALG